MLFRKEIGICCQKFIVLENSLIQNIAKVLSANIISRILNFAIAIFIIKKLSVSDFGAFTFGMYILQIIPQLLDFGLNETVVRFGAKTLENRQKLKIVLTYVLKIRLITAFCILIAGFLFIPYIIPFLFKNKNLVNVTLLGIIGSIGIFFWNYVQSYYRIKEDFNRLSVYNIIYSILLVVFTVLVFRLRGNSYIWIFGVYVLTPFFCSFLFGKPILTFIDFKLSPSNRLRKELVHYNFWLTLSTVSFFGLRQLDILFLTYFCDLNTVGIYGAAQRLTIPFRMLGQAMAQVLLPRVSRYKNRVHFSRFIRYSYYFVLLLGKIAIICAVLAPFIFSIFPQNYDASVPIFQLLIFLPVAGTLANLMSFIFLSIGKPEIPSKINIVQMLINLFLSIILIPLYNAIGAAISVLITAIFGAICQVYFAERYVNHA